jgi:hypothetical protein
MSAALQTTKEKNRKTSQKPAKKNAKTRKKPQILKSPCFR